MAKRIKWTIDLAKQVFTEKGYELLEDEYINYKTKMKYNCPYHINKDTKMSMEAIQKGNKCPYCSRNISSIDDIKKEFSDRGYILLSNCYQGVSDKVEYKCCKHPNKCQTITVNNFRKGSGCAFCAREKVANNQKAITIEELRKLFEERGYKLLESEYKSNNAPLRFRCPKHPQRATKITYTAFKSGTGCIYCIQERFIGEGNPRWKGGTKKLKVHFRNIIRTWNKEMLEKYGFKCFITGDKDCLLEIHHIVPFNEIVADVMKATGINEFKTFREYSKNEQDLLRNEFIKRHSNIEGIPLKKDIHRLFHSIYGNDTTIDNIYEFKERYLLGEFKDVQPTEEQLSLIV